MRKAPGKNRGYVILPVVVPAGVEPDKALDNNDAFSVVWKVLQALRSHDDHFDAFVNKLDLVGINNSKMEVIAVTDNIARPRTGKQRPGSGHTLDGHETKASSRLNNLKFTLRSVRLSGPFTPRL